MRIEPVKPCTRVSPGLVARGASRIDKTQRKLELARSARPLNARPRRRAPNRLASPDATRERPYRERNNRGRASSYAAREFRGNFFQFLHRVGPKKNTGSADESFNTLAAYRGSLIPADCSRFGRAKLMRMSVNLLTYNFFQDYVR